MEPRCTSADQKVPVFICYRQADGRKTALWLYENLEGRQLPDRDHDDGDAPEQADGLSVYLDTASPAVSDWHDYHLPSLQRSRAMLLVCTPGIATRLGDDDWVYMEIEWWLQHRHTAPIIVDTTGEGDRWLPQSIRSRWPNVQRLEVRLDTWESLPPEEAALQCKLALARIVSGIVASETGVRFEDLEREKHRVRRTRAALVVTAVALLCSILAAVWAIHSSRLARRREVEARRSEAAATRSAGKEKRSADKAIKMKHLAEENERKATAERKLAEEARDAARLMQQRLCDVVTRIATKYVESGQNNLAATYLTSTPIEARGWEMKYLARIASGTPLTLFGHEGKVTDAVFTSDGEQLISLGGTTIRFWDAGTGKLLQTRKLFGIGVQLVNAPGWAGDHQCLSTDGHRLISLHSLHGAPALSPADPLGVREQPGEYLGQITIWDSETGVELAKRTVTRGASVALSPDSQHFVIGLFGSTIQVGSAETGETEFDLTSTSAEAAPVRSIAFRQDERRIACGLESGRVLVWDLDTRTELFTVDGHSRQVTGVSFSPDGRFVISGGEDGLAVIYDACSGERVSFTKCEDGAITCVTFSPDGRYAAFGSENGTVQIFNARTGKQASVLRGHELTVSTVSFSPDGRRLASGGVDGMLKVWNLETDAASRTFSGTGAEVHLIAFDTDGRRIISVAGDGTVKLWDSIKVRALQHVPLQEKIVSRVAVSPDCSRIAGANAQGEMKAWNIDTGTPILDLSPAETWCQAIAFSPDGEQIAGVDKNGFPKLWDVETGRATLEFRSRPKLPPAQNSSVALPPRPTPTASNGDAAADKTIPFEDPSEPNAVDLPTEKHSHQSRLLPIMTGFWHPPPASLLLQVIFSPSGRRIATVNERGRVRIWDTTTGSELSPVPSLSYVNSLDFSPDGQRLAMANLKGFVNVWDIPRGEFSLRMSGGYYGESSMVAFSPDGQRLAITGSGASFHLYDAGTGIPLATLWRRESEGNEPAGRVGGSGERLAWHRHLAFSPLGEQMVRIGVRSFRIFDARQATVTLTLGFDQAGFVQHLALSPGGEWVAGVKSDRKVCMWDTKTGMIVLEHRDHSDRVESLVFSADGGQIISRDIGGVQCVWDTITGSRSDKADVSEKVFSGTISADGLVSVFSNGELVRVVRTNPDYDPWAEDALRREAWDADWSERDAAESEAAGDWFAACFHLRHLVELRPDDTDLIVRLKKAESELARDAPPQTTQGPE
jgi:WD40 repeat protein